MWLIQLGNYVFTPIILFCSIHLGYGESTDFFTTQKGKGKCSYSGKYGQHSVTPNFVLKEQRKNNDALICMQQSIYTWVCNMYILMCVLYNKPIMCPVILKWNSHIRENSRVLYVLLVLLSLCSISQVSKCYSQVDILGLICSPQEGNVLEEI